MKTILFLLLMLMASFEAVAPGAVLDQLVKECKEHCVTPEVGFTELMCDRLVCSLTAQSGTVSRDVRRGCKATCNKLGFPSDACTTRLCI